MDAKMDMIVNLIIKRQIRTIWTNLWWKCFVGEVIYVPWPRKEPCDPNYHYRSWLETNVGKQAISWDWDVKIDEEGNGLLKLGFSKRKAKWATVATLIMS